MNTATENLKNDHVHILKLTEIMEQIAETPDPEIKDLESIVNLIKNFADRFHHAKEENLLFPLLGKKGFSKENGPVAVMLMEHESGRNFTQIMTESINLYKKGDHNSIHSIRENLMNYVNLLRNHIDKENNILFRMADNMLNSDEQQSLLDQFKEVEKNTGNQQLENYIIQIDELSKAYSI